MLTSPRNKLKSIPLKLYNSSGLYNFGLVPILGLRVSGGLLKMTNKKKGMQRAEQTLSLSLSLAQFSLSQIIFLREKKRSKERKREKLLQLSAFPCFFQTFDLLDLSSWQDKSSSRKGWVSIDRSVVAALPSTTPRPVHKSSTDDLGSPLCQVSDRESRRHF